MQCRHPTPFLSPPSPISSFAQVKISYTARHVFTAIPATSAMRLVADGEDFNFTHTNHHGFMLCESLSLIPPSTEQQQTLLFFKTKFLKRLQLRFYNKKKGRVSVDTNVLCNTRASFEPTPARAYCNARPLTIGFGMTRKAIRYGVSWPTSFRICCRPISSSLGAL